jgi:hypothetical protein
MWRGAAVVPTHQQRLIHRREKTRMENTGTVTPLNINFPNRPTLTFALVTDFVNKTVSLIAIDPSQPSNSQLKVHEVQNYTKVGI